MFAPDGILELWKCPSWLHSQHQYVTMWLVVPDFKGCLDFENKYVCVSFFLAPSAWECLISPSSSRPLLYDANKISPSFMLALTRSHLSRAFVEVALSYTCSNLPAILCYLYCARGLPFVLWKCMKVTTWSHCSITTAIILTKGSQSVQALRAFKVQC